MIVGAGPAGLPPPCTAPRRAGARSWSSGRRPAARPAPPPDRELPRVPVGVSGDELASRALQQARRLGAEILVTRAITRIDTASRQVHRRRRRDPRAHDHSGLRRRVATGVGRRVRPARRQGHLAGAARSEASSTHGLDVHIIGAGNSAGQAALFFSTHARSVTLLCRGESPRAQYVALSDRPAMARRNIETLFGTEVTAAARRPGRWRPSTSTTPRPARRPASTRAGCTSSSARMRRRHGSHPTSRSMPAATC